MTRPNAFESSSLKHIVGGTCRPSKVRVIPDHFIDFTLASREILRSSQHSFSAIALLCYPFVVSLLDTCFELASAR